MKNYIIGFLVVCLAVLGSFFYRVSITPVLDRFPIESPVNSTPRGDPPLYLFIFFSQHNCNVCLEAIDILNELPPQFVVTGIVPASELKNETELRQISGAAFNLIAYKPSYKKFKPNYTPAIFGVGCNGNILFVLPGVPGEKEYLYNFLSNFYGKSIELLLPPPGT